MKDRRNVASSYETLHETVQLVLLQQLGWDTLRDVQEETLSAVRSGGDVLVAAPTAGGKTEAALIPVVDGILKEGLPGIAALYLSPLKALINDQEERFSRFCTPTGLLVQKWHGDVPRGDRAWAAGEPPHLLMITPESLEVLMLEPVLAADLGALHYVIVDEIHAFVESQRGAHLRLLLDRLDRLAGRNVQRIGLSATPGNPEAVLDWFSDRDRSRHLVSMPSLPREHRFSFFVDPSQETRMSALVRAVEHKKAIVFVNSRSDAERVMADLSSRIGHVWVHHSSLSPAARQTSEKAFISADHACMVCTSTLELGIDVGDLDLVVQFGPPPSVSSLLQRMGRSGRRGRPPHTHFILPDECGMLCSCAAIEAACLRELEELIPLTLPYDVLIQQILLDIRRHGRSSGRKLEQTLLPMAPFRMITRERFRRLISHLTKTGYLVRDGELLMAGPAAEFLYGKSNWKDLYSVINGAGEVRAMTPDGEIIGRLDPRFVQSQKNGEFSLGGKRWTMVGGDGERRVVVVPGNEQGASVFWTGHRTGMSPVICHAALRIAARGKSALPLSRREEGWLPAISTLLPRGLSPDAIHLWEPDPGSGEVRVFTFGGQRNTFLLGVLTSRYLAGKIRMRYGDFSLLFRGPKRTTGTAQVRSAVEQVRLLELADIDGLVPVPPAKTWKFGDAIPRWAAQEMGVTDQYRTSAFRDWLVSRELVELSPGRDGHSSPE